MPNKKVLFDCDGTLVLSEHKAFAACCAVVNETLARKGVQKQFTPEELMQRFVGKSFWGMITELSKEHGFVIEEEELKTLVLEEENRVIAILSAEVEPTPGVNAVLEKLSTMNCVDAMAVVTSSALRRVVACLKKVDQERYFGTRVYSAATSLAVPTTKPDPAIYLHALQEIGAQASECVAIEDSRSGVTAAKRAGIPVVGYVGSFPEHEQAQQARILSEAGAFVVIKHWDEFLPVLEKLAGGQPTC
jgi:HAD superfamily hydrolase (TIGR01509 family)